MEFQQMLIFMLTHLKKRQQTSGFTLIELMIVLMIIGILTAIGLPNLMGQIGKARESEAKTTLSTIAKAQELYFAEKAQFADNLDKLEVGLNQRYYSYAQPTIVGTQTVKHQAIAQNAANNNIRNYTLGIYHSNTGVFSLILCQSLTPSTPSTLADVPDTPTGSCNIGTQIQ